MATSRCATSFTEDGNYLAYSGTDGSLRILDTVSGNPLADFIPNHQLIMLCTCAKWSPGRHLKSQSSPPQKKRKKSDMEKAVSDLGLVAMGTASGTIFLYSFSKGQLHTQLEKGHMAAVTDVCWHPNGTTLYSSSLDGHVVEWDVPSSRLKRKWKASNGSVHSICLCGSDRLLTADRSIKMWDLSSKKVIWKFTGHSTEVFRVLPVLLQSSADEDGENDASACSYFISAAANDKVVNAWLFHPDSSEKNAVASFSLTEEPAELTLQVTNDQMMILSVLTTKGKVLIFEHTFSGQLQKPLKAQTVVQATTEGSKEEVPMPVPILAATPRAADTDSPGLLVAHGSLLRPKFASVELRPTQPEILVVVSKPEKKATKTDHSQVKTPEVVGSTVLYPSHITPGGPSTEGPSRRKRKKSVSELTVNERLEAMGVEGPGQMAGSGRPPKANQLVIQLTQGLQSSDGKLLTNAFQERNNTVIQNTVKKLPLHLIHPLVKEVTKRMHGHFQIGLVMDKWLEQIICIHMAYISTVPEIMDTLQQLVQYINYRLQSFPKNKEMINRLNVLQAKGAMENKVEKPSVVPPPLLVYQCESDSEEDDQMEVESPQSEDDWEDSDES